MLWFRYLPRIREPKTEIADGEDVVADEQGLSMVEYRAFNEQSFMAIDEHWDERGDPSAPVTGLGLWIADLSRMNSAEIRSYLGWRETVRRSERPAILDEGYIRLYIVEIIHTGSKNPRATLLKLVEAVETLDQPFIDNVPLEYAISKEIPLKDLPDNYRDRKRDVVDGMALNRYPIEGLTKATVDELTCLPDADPEIEDMAKDCLMFTLRCLDEYIRSRYGRTLSDGIPFSSEGKYLLSGFPEKGQKKADTIYSTDVFRMSGDSLFHDVGQIIHAEFLGVEPFRRQKSDLDPDMADVVRNAVRSFLKEGASEPARFRYTGAGAFTGDLDFPRNEFKGVGTADRQKKSAKPRNVPEPKKRSKSQRTEPEPVFKGPESDPPRLRRKIECPDTDLIPEFSAHVLDSIDEFVMYVPSGSRTPTWGTMNEDQARFYTAWRTQLRNGEHPDGDAGYAWLYICELINSSGDKRRIYSRLMDFADNYGKLGCEFIERAPYHWALEHDLPLRPLDGYLRDDQWLDYLRLRHRPIDYLSMTSIKGIARMEPKIEKKCGTVCEEALNRAIRAVDREMEKAGQRLYQLNKAKSNVQFKLYDELYRPGHSTLEIQCGNAHSRDRLSDMMADILITAIRRLEWRMCNKSGGVLIGFDYLDVVNDAVDSYLREIGRYRWTGRSECLTYLTGSDRTETGVVTLRGSRDPTRTVNDQEFSREDEVFHRRGRNPLMMPSVAP